MSQFIHFFKYLDYHKLYDLGFEFNKPTKNSVNTYIAKLRQPISFIIPKSEILEVYQDSFSNNKFKYHVNTEKHSEFLTFIENLDGIAVDVASNNSKLWFNKELDMNVLVNHYKSICDISEDEDDYECTCDFEINNLEYLDNIAEYNEDDDMNIIVSIKGIEFFKKIFRWKIELEDIIKDIDTDSDSDEETSSNETESTSSNDTESTSSSESESSEEGLNFDDMLSSEKKVPEKKLEDTIQIANKQSRDLEEYSISNSDVINKEMINELANLEEIHTQIRDNINKKNEDTNSKLSLVEVESIITQKREEAKKYFINAERARRASDSLQKKAIDASNEIKKYEEILKEKSQSSSLLKM